MKIEKFHLSQPRVIRTLSDWEVHAGPKSKDQWVQERSAWELANAWCGNPDPEMPACIRELLDACPETCGFLPDVAWPEHQVSFDSYGGPRNADLAVVGHTPTSKIAITIEAKADEPFGDTVGGTFAAAIERAIQSAESGGVRRIEELSRALFHNAEKGQAPVAALRYQLLTAAAGTIAFADQQGADLAVLLVHEFITEKTTDERHAQNAADYVSFLRRLGAKTVPDAPHLLGPISIPGGTLFSGGRRLYIGKVTTNRRRYAISAPTRRLQFSRYIGIDYSGAETPDASLKGLRLFSADQVAIPIEVGPPAGLKKYWTRKAIAHWLVDQLASGVPTIVGIDHGFSFPLAYFQKYGVAHAWDEFLDDFCAHWPTDGDNTYVDFVRDGACGNGAARMGSTRWRRVAEQRSKSAKSLFHFDVQGSVAKSTHAGLPWLRFIRRNVRRPLHFWPFDGWEIPEGSSAVVEVYPRLWNRQYPAGDRNPDQHDAWVVAEWMRVADAGGDLSAALRPPRDPQTRLAAEVEGWILSVS